MSVEDALVYAFYCHCSRCRRRTGSAFAAIGGIEVDKLRVTSGGEQVLIIGESADGFACVCKQCLSPLYTVVRQRKFAHVALGVLSGAPSRQPDHHIHVGSKATWYEIKDGLPQFEVLPPGNEG